jgi:transmembrane sensor
MPNDREYLDLIVKHLNNPEDEELRAVVFSFRSESADQERYFLEIEKIWSLSPKTARLGVINVKKSSKNLKKALTANSHSRRTTFYWLSRVAAILVLAFAGLWIYKSNTNELFIVKTTQKNELDTVALIDGSRIILAENSTLKYSEDFNAKERSVYLVKGKAFFEIAKDPKHPFKVKMEESEVSVVGTSFNISFSTSKIDLDVKTGKVIFSPNKEGESSILTAGQALTYNVLKRELTSRLSQNADSWLTKELVFVDTPLEEVCKQLSEYYQTDIKLQNRKHSDKKLNAVFTNQPLADVLTLLNETYNIKIRKENNKIILITP